MTALDVTAAFRSAYQTAQSSSSTTLPAAYAHRPPAPRGRPSTSTSTASASLQDVDEIDDFLSEAYKIHDHIQTLLAQLRTIRRQYLSILPSSSLAISKGKERDRGLTDTERDELDLHTKILLKRCLERILVLESREAKDGGPSNKKFKNQAPGPTTSSRLLSLIVPPSLQPTLSSFVGGSSTAHNTLLAAHHASILFHLHASLSTAGETFSALQAERVRRIEESTSRSLGGGLGYLMENQASQGGTKPVHVPPPVVIKREGEAELSQEQIQLFESENAQMLEGYNEHLEQIQKTQQTLLQISTLQSLLTQSLLQQSETSDRLLLEAGQGVSDVRAGNAQLVKAKERGGSGRTMLLAFLIGASLALLFLDWYS